MDGSTYTLSGESFSGSIVYQFDIKQSIQSITFCDIEPPVKRYFLDKMPEDIEHLKRIVKVLKQKGKAVKLDIIEADFSFKRFWDEYDNKIGKKVRTENIWKAMSNIYRIVFINEINFETQSIRRLFVP